MMDSRKSVPNDEHAGQTSDGDEELSDTKREGTFADSVEVDNS